MAEPTPAFSVVSENGVAVNVHFIPMPLLTFFKGLGYKIENHPSAYSNFKTEISLPIYPQLTDSQVGIVSKVVIDSYNEIIKSNAQKIF